MTATWSTHRRRWALRDRLDLAGRKVAANYEGLGPFRPVLWAHWELQAELFQASAWRWRLARIVWATLAAAALLRLLLTLDIVPRAALFATALAMWNPWRNEIWRSLTLSEGVAMPYALTPPWCAQREPLAVHDPGRGTLAEAFVRRPPSAARTLSPRSYPRSFCCAWRPPGTTSSPAAGATDGTQPRFR